VSLEIFSEHDNVDQLHHAMRSMHKAMKWDEERYGLEYDLDVYNIVAVGDFNMGAMENKGGLVVGHLLPPVVIVADMLATISFCDSLVKKVS
jgi:aminopeptidase N